MKNCCNAWLRQFLAPIDNGAPMVRRQLSDVQKFVGLDELRAHVQSRQLKILTIEDQVVVYRSSGFMKL